jgi:hypothetical protein
MNSSDYVILRKGSVLLIQRPYQMAIPGCIHHLSYMRIIQVEKVVRKNQRQLIYIHEKPSKILSRHGGHVHNVPAVSKYPEISRVYSLETVPTEGA